MVLRKYIIGGGIAAGFVGSFFMGYGAHTLKSSANGLAMQPILGLAHTDSQGGGFVQPNDPGKTTDFAQFWNTWATLDQYFAPANGTSSLPSSDERVLAAIAGLTASYGDPYTVFLPTERADALKESVRGDFEGIGAVLAQIDMGAIVTGILPDSPAATAGLQVGNLVVAVNNQNIVDMPLKNVIDKIRGASGTSVALTLSRNGTTETLTITRGKVIIPTVASAVVTRAEEVVKELSESVNETASMLGGAVSDIIFKKEKQKPEVVTRTHRLVRLTGFAESSVKAFEKELKEFATSDERTFILDLRDNPGGEVMVATEIASHFLPKDAVVARIRSAHGDNEEKYVSRGYTTLAKKNNHCVAVLLNKNSASASEILAAALHDHGVAKLVGEKSYGKGSVQQLAEIGSLGTLKITIAHWFTPNNVSISLEGVTPEFALSTTSPATTGDPYIDTALDVCKK